MCWREKYLEGERRGGRAREGEGGQWETWSDARWPRTHTHTHTHTHMHAHTHHTHTHIHTQTHGSICATTDWLCDELLGLGLRDETRGGGGGGGDKGDRGW